MPSPPEDPRSAHTRALREAHYRALQAWGIRGFVKRSRFDAASPSAAALLDPAEDPTGAKLESISKPRLG